VAQTIKACAQIQRASVSWYPANAHRFLIKLEFIRSIDSGQNQWRYRDFYEA
jgi:hypothetical protein